MAPPGGLFLSAHKLPVQTEKTASFGVESRDPTANLCPSSKIPDFLRVGGRGRIEKRRFSRFLGWVFCRSATAYIEHQIYMQKAWIISGDVVDVPFGGKRPPRITEPQWGPPNPENFSIQKFVFYGQSDAEKFAYFNHYFRNPTKKWRIYRKNVISE